MSVYEERALICPHCQHQSIQAVAVSLDGGPYVDLGRIFAPRPSSAVA